jgi:hypothetical protein
LFYQEYGISKEEKLKIAQGIVTPLLRKIKADLKSNLTGIWDCEDSIVNQLDPKYHFFVCFHLKINSNLKQISLTKFIKNKLFKRHTYAWPTCAYTTLLHKRKPHIFASYRA